MNLNGSLALELKSGELILHSTDFELQEEDYRYLGDGERQLEQLYTYTNETDDGEYINLSIQVTKYNGSIKLYPLENRGDGNVTEAWLGV
ncbi:MAG: hypothetical protein HRT52_11695 [Colwellia sp.]|nr:hypothetical protein [Colwellia sp.]NQZ81669.1 hypothetical protein [Colwellia sp.]